MNFGGVYQGKTVLVTGHTGFKGSWLSLWLKQLGARVVGYALDPLTDMGNFGACRLHERLDADIRSDIRDADAVLAAIQRHQPEIIFHLAAQPLVKPSYEQPRYTYETNLMGSLNVLEAARACSGVKTVVMITSDKCYENVEQVWGYRENDKMGGYDPYSSSKGCAEIMIASFRRSFFHPAQHSIHGKSVASARAGNVIGGGDWSDYRLIPDCIRAIEAGREILIRNPRSTRPWQHVLDPLSGYLLLGQKMIERPKDFADSYNFGPPPEANRSVWEVVDKLVTIYGSGKMIDASRPDAEHESRLLHLDISKAHAELDWWPHHSLDEALDKTVAWYKAALSGGDMFDFCVAQIKALR